MTIDGVPVTQIFRVLAIFAKEPRDWRLVALHWSNAGPIPPLPRSSAGSDVTTPP